MQTTVFNTRRDALSQSMTPGQSLIVFAASESPLVLRFQQDKNFFYLTGLIIPDAVLVMRKEKDKTVETLFIQRNIPERVVWDGQKMLAEEATAISGVQQIQYLDEFESGILYTVINSEKIFFNSGTLDLSKPLNKPLQFAQRVKKHYPHVMFKDMLDLVRPLRAIKDETEVAELQKAIDITGAGIVKIWETAKAGMMEYELEATLYHTMLSNGFRYWGFTPIIATGINAATLHYIQNDTQINEDELVLLDVGAACNNYSADITRTFPISGKFTGRQKDVYAAVLHVQKEVIAMLKPGIAMKAVNEKTVELITEALINLNLITEASDYKKYYMHSVGHHLGLDTHDVGGTREFMLEPGNIITIEPGIYIPEEGIGVRIEDDILITEDGYINLSAAIPKEIADIENIRKKAFI